MGIVAIAASVGTAGKMAYDKISIVAEEHGTGKFEAAKSIILGGKLTQNLSYKGRA